MLILLIILFLLVAGGVGYYSYHRWGAAEGIGGVLLVVLALLFSLDTRVLVHWARLLR
jgi:hypothetical protein